jgi:hypothetical protein
LAADAIQKMMDVLDAAEIAGGRQTDYGRRLRGSSNSSMFRDSNEEKNRNLQKYPAQCK